MKVICITDQLELHKGKAYEVHSVGSNGTHIEVVSENERVVDGNINEDFIWAHEDDPSLNTRDYRETYWSLVNSLTEAGGAGKDLVSRNLDMPLGEFLKTIAPNHIRFTYLNPEVYLKRIFSAIG